MLWHGCFKKKYKIKYLRVIIYLIVNNIERLGFCRNNTCKPSLHFILIDVLTYKYIILTSVLLYKIINVISSLELLYWEIDKNINRLKGKNYVKS